MSQYKNKEFVLKNIKVIESEIGKAFESFMAKLQKMKLYNEASLQHELGYYLRLFFNALDEEDRLKIDFERNIESIIKCDKSRYLKKEIDLLLSYSDFFKSAVEMKFVLTKNGRTPETMYDFCNDIAFLESLVESGFNKCYFFAVAENSSHFMQGQKVDGIYKCFREDKIIQGVIEKPTGSKREYIEIKGKYQIEWKLLNEDYSYLLIEIFDKEARNKRIADLKEQGLSIPKIANMYGLSNPAVFNILKKSASKVDESFIIV